MEVTEVRLKSLFFFIRQIEIEGAVGAQWVGTYKFVNYA